MKKMSYLFLSFFLSTVVVAQQKPDSTVVDYYDMSLEDLLNVKVSIASKTELTVRESPSIVSVITGEEIKNMGARDLIDILSLIPGFNFGVDVGGVVGMSTRGNWSHEGKVLLLLDGQEMNDIVYGNTAFGMHYDPSQIERIEIIRGPGSSLYGGFAELGVVNIVTKSGEVMKGGQLNVMAGRLSDSFGRKTATASFGNTTENITYSIAGYLGNAVRSNIGYRDIFGSTADAKNTSDIQARMLNIGLSTGKLSARFIYDAYANYAPWFYASIVSPSLSKVTFNSYYSEIKYDGRINRKLSITPKINFKTGDPWFCNVSEIGISPTDFRIQATRIAPSVNLKYTVSREVDLVAGVDSYYDNGKRLSGGSAGNLFYNGTDRVNFNNVGAFFQMSIRKKAVPFFVGARVDNHSQYGTAFSPRVGITRVFDKWHLKALYSRAFRAPVLENLNLNPELKPERTGVAEIELGYKLLDKSYLTVNAYDIRIVDPIVYYATVDFPSGNYVNYKRTGTRGIEFEYRYKAKVGYLVANYAYYSAKGINEVPVYQVPGQDKVLLAWPGHRINTYANIQVTKSFSVNPAISYMSKRYGLTEYDAANDQVVYGTIPSKIYLNLFLRYKNLMTEGLELSAGVNDIANQRQVFIQPYDSWSAPMTGVGREVVVRLSYGFHFRN